MAFLRYENVSHWPRLAWLAIVNKRSGDCLVRHGPWVETGDSQFSEAIWAGDFARGDLDETDLVVGSGARARSDHITFVSSGNTVDRLQYWENEQVLQVSNSLPCLVNALSATVDPAYDKYFKDFRSIVRGLSKYKKILRSSVGDIHLVYFNNIRWTGSAVSIIEKPNKDRQFVDFDDYRAFLSDTVSRLFTNAQSESRSHPFSPLGTLSSGYDSPTVCVLSRDAGLNEVLSFATARGGANDSGEKIAHILKLNTIHAHRSQWRNAILPEVPFLAVNAFGEEMHYRGVEQHLAGRVLMTGFHGDKVWGRDTKNLSDDIVRGDPSGTSLSEFRLWTGFLHCPLPFFGVRSISNIVKISRSESMKPWDIDNKYSRPICRRIVEQAGIPRHIFGIRKRAASVLLKRRAEGFLTETSKASFYPWLQDKESAWLDRGDTPPLHKLEKHLRKDVPLHLLCSGARLMASMPHPQMLAHRFRQLRWLADDKDPLNNKAQLFYHLFPWALEHAKQRYL